jgi:hypothetical protein
MNRRPDTPETGSTHFGAWDGQTGMMPPVENQAAGVPGHRGGAGSHAEPDEGSVSGPATVEAVGRGEDDVPRGAHVMRGEALMELSRGTHLTKGDRFLSVERRARHALKTESINAEDVRCHSTSGAGSLPDTATDFSTTDDEITAMVMAPGPTTGNHTHAGNGRRRWPLIAVAAAAGALAIGLGGGGAFAYFSTAGSGAGQAKGASPIPAASIVATTGPADLLPGGTGAVYFTIHNSSPSGATFDVVETGTTVQSSNTALCGDNKLSIAQPLPYVFSPAVTVNANSTSGPESIPALVALSPSAPSTCQGLTFTITFTLTGQST